MESEDLERLLDSGRFQHLSEATLMSYRDYRLDEIRAAIADAHLKICLVCEHRLTFLKSEADAADEYDMTEDDHAAVKWTLTTLKASNWTVPQTAIRVEGLKTNLAILLDSWMVFTKKDGPSCDGGGEVWRDESEDGLLTAWVVLDQDLRQTLHFSSPELAWEGTQIRLRLGPFNTEIAFQLEVDSATVVADLTIPSETPANQLLDYSIEILSSNGTN